ncbi:MAG: WGxxGxxG family protein [Snowella sp.]|nr:WGxxGxxG family protein [Snowella sp.]
MKLSKYSQIAGAGIAAFSLANLISVVPASAQTGTDIPNNTGTTTIPNTGTGTTAYGYRDDGFDWGWLGLIGLAGLAGLTGKNRQEHSSTYRDPNIR